MLAAIAAALRCMASAAATAARYCWLALDWTLHLPGRLLGGGPAGTVPHPTYQPPAEDAAAEIADMVAKRGGARAVRGALPLDLEPRADGTDPISATVHAYARAAPSERGRIDFSSLSPDQYAWLARLTEIDLQRLAQAGGLVCGRLARRVAGGALGVAPCKQREPELDDVDLMEREPEAPAKLDYGPGFADRVRRHRPGVRRAA